MLRFQQLFKMAETTAKKLKTPPVIGTHKYTPAFFAPMMFVWLLINYSFFLLAAISMLMKLWLSISSVCSLPTRLLLSFAPEILLSSSSAIPWSMSAGSMMPRATAMTITNGLSRLSSPTTTPSSPLLDWYTCTLAAPSLPSTRRCR